jgi:DNA-3-methyladenine glycosylase II
MRRIDTLQDINDGLDALLALEPRLTHVAAIAGEVPLRRHPAGFESLAGIIVSQQISKASADAIFSRLKAAIDPFTPQSLLEAGEGGLAGAQSRKPSSPSRKPARTGLIWQICASFPRRTPSPP